MLYLDTHLDEICARITKQIILDTLMYDDYDLDYSYTSEYGEIEEELDEDYARDSNDYQDMAYRHYA